jgi:hypothetical protein
MSDDTPLPFDLPADEAYGEERWLDELAELHKKTYLGVPRPHPSPSPESGKGFLAAGFFTPA